MTICIEVWKIWTAIGIIGTGMVIAAGLGIYQMIRRDNRSSKKSDFPDTL